MQSHEHSLKAYLRGSFPNVRDVDDVVQESYVRIWKTRLTQPIRSAKGFLFHVARNLAIDFVRKDRSPSIDSLRDSRALSVIQDGPNALESLTLHEKVDILAEALGALPVRCRNVVVLRKLKGISQKQIATDMRISERTVESQVTRGMKLLEAHLRRRGVTGFSIDG